MLPAVISIVCMSTMVCIIIYTGMKVSVTVLPREGLNSFRSPVVSACGDAVSHCGFLYSQASTPQLFTVQVCVCVHVCLRTYMCACVYAHLEKN